MSLHKHALIRYRIIDAMLRNEYRPYPTLEAIRAKCEDSLFGSDWGDHISISTIEKDFYAMRNDMELGFMAPIKYSRAHGGYYYTDPDYTIHNIPLKTDDIDAIKFAANTLFNFRESPLFDQFKFAIEKIFDRLNIADEVQDERLDKVVQFDSYPEYPGNEYLQPIFGAINDFKKVIVTYQRFGAEAASIRTIHPYLLKEYRYRWYLIGYSEERERIVTYALDRIKKIEIQEKEFDLNLKFDPDTFFEYSFGITQIDSEVQEVLLRFPASQQGYLNTQPLHKSQEIMEENEGFFKLKMKVGITFELVEKMLSYGDQVEILEPQILKEKVVERLRKAVANYE